MHGQTGRYIHSYTSQWVLHYSRECWSCYYWRSGIRGQGEEWVILQNDLLYGKLTRIKMLHFTALSIALVFLFLAPIRVVLILQPQERMPCHMPLSSTLSARVQRDLRSVKRRPPGGQTYLWRTGRSDRKMLARAFIQANNRKSGAALGSLCKCWRGIRPRQCDTHMGKDVEVAANRHGDNHRYSYWWLGWQCP